jgi:hypothetical protein
MSNPLLQFILGLLLVVTGRKLFWLFVGVLGFLSGILFATQFFPAESKLMIFAIGLVAGLVGAVLAIFLQQLIVLLAGFLAGGHLTIRLLSLFDWRMDHYLWVLFLLGGVFGAVLALMLLDWALIILSSAIGAVLISQALFPDRGLAALSFVVLAIAGILIQSRLTLRPLPRT